MVDDLYMTRDDMARAADILHTYMQDMPHGHIGKVPHKLTSDLLQVERDGRAVPVTLAILKLLDDAMDGRLHQPAFIEVMQLNSIELHTVEDFTDYGPEVSSP